MTTFRTPLEVLALENSYLGVEGHDALEAELEELERVDREREKGGSWAENLGPVVD